ncbi:MAG TPA: ribose-5-phosphate isomerase RpiA [Methanotrichaceae archaeon]|nr:ribose-5-phosphate isomerase RpiA [Methanotrichaceae archaeon]
MKVATANQEEKKAVGESAAALVRDGMVVGLGTGSTVAWTIKNLGARIKDEGLDILGVPTSYQAEALAIASGITLTSLSQHPVLDLAIDGVDQVDAALFAIKGGGAAHTREKVVSCSAKRFVVVADGSKYLGKMNHPVPVEVLPFAANLVEQRLKEMGGKPVLRIGKMKDGPVITDNGNFVMDVDFGVIEDPRSLAAWLCPIPGMVEHGIFDNVDELHLARSGGVEIIRRR